MDINKLKEQITIEQIYDLVDYLGGDPRRKGDNIICRTICHCGSSHKLWFYENTHLFKCYTDCGDYFDQFTLVSRVENIDLPQAIHFVCNYLGITEEEDQYEQQKLQDWEIFKQKESHSLKNKQKKIALPIFNSDIIKYYPTPIIQPWVQDNISVLAMKTFNIKYDPCDCSIIIPHYDINDNLIGIRKRTLIKQEEYWGKYRPAIIGRKQYNHPLGFNLYGINKNKENIRLLKKAIIFESEKSVLQFQSYGIPNISVAVCGSSFTDYQFSLLNSLGVEQIIIGFDKQWQQKNNDQHKRWIKKLLNIYNKYSTYVNITYLYDKTDLLGYKCSPTDAGYQIFMNLFAHRISPKECKI